MEMDRQSRLYVRTKCLTQTTLSSEEGNNCVTVCVYVYVLWLASEKRVSPSQRIAEGCGKMDADGKQKFG